MHKHTGAFYKHRIIFISFCLLSVFTYGIRSAKAWSFTENSGIDNTAQKLGFTQGDDLSIEEKAGNVLAIFLSFLGVIFLALMIFAGWKWMTAQGNESEVESAKKILRDAIIGLVIVLGAYAITMFAKEFMNIK
jgi:hypothetical protein